MICLTNLIDFFSKSTSYPKIESYIPSGYIPDKRVTNPKTLIIWPIARSKFIIYYRLYFKVSITYLGCTLYCDVVVRY